MARKTESHPALGDTIKGRTRKQLLGFSFPKSTLFVQESVKSVDARSRKLRLIMLFPFILLACVPPSFLHAQSNPSPAKFLGKVVSERTNEPLSGSVVFLAGTRFGTTTRQDGSFQIEDVPPGHYEVKVSMLGYRPLSKQIVLQPGAKLEAVFQLQSIPIEFPDVEIIGSVPEAFLKIPGSGILVSSDLLLRTHPLAVNEVLRKVPGILVRDEEGFGIRPNIGIRGLFPTRSTKVLLLEDGVPFALAPYGDPASYYHPPVHRFDRIEVLKGSGQILFGPQTIGGVINYLTPLPPAVPTGTLNLVAGNRDYLFGQVNYGGRWQNVGYLLDYSRKQGRLARENSSTTIQDLNSKFILNVSTTSSLTVKLNLYDERSNVTYPGLTQVEYEENPFQNPFKDDWFYFRRYGTHLIHDQALYGGKILLSTNLYGYFIKRDWWRQGNNGGTNSTPPPNTPGSRTILNPTRNDGRNREYTVWGVEPRLRLSHSFSDVQNETDFGFRAHFEIQDRKQIMGDSPVSRTGTFLEDNIRKVQAYSTFLQNRFLLGEKGTISTGIRIEEINYQRTNNLNGATGRMHLGTVIPGFGATLNPAQHVTVFAGVHRGFAPPRVEDVISNTDGSSTDLDAEKSWNFELGVRAKASSFVHADVTFFRLDFENQIIPSSLAGGSGTVMTNAGSTLHQGLELKSTIGLTPREGSSLEGAAGLAHRVTIDLAYTYLAIARFRGERFSVIDPAIRVTGNRLTYAPKHMLTAGAAYSQAAGLDCRLEVVYISKQFSDDLNTITPSPNGRQGIIPAYTVWNLSVEYPVAPLHVTAFLTVKNLLNRVYIVDRSRGILPGSPRLVQGGLRWVF